MEVDVEFAVILLPLSESSTKMEENMLLELSKDSKILPFADTVEVTLCNNLLIARFVIFFIG